MNIWGWICILMLSMAASAFAEATLKLGPASVSGTTLSFPVTLVNVPGTSISGIDALITFNSEVFALKMNGNILASATAGSATIAAGKQVNQNAQGDGVLHIVIIDLGNPAAIPDGVVAQIGLDIIAATTSSSETFAILPSATDPGGTPVTITGSATTAPGTRQLAVTFSGNGGGSVNSIPAGIACTESSCSASFFNGSVVTLIATAAASSGFEGWSGACAGSGVCNATMISDLSAKATFVTNNAVLAGAEFFETLNGAYSSIPDNTVVQAMGIAFFEDLDLSRVIAVTLQGGCDSSFKNCIGYTTIDGTVSVSKGSLVAERLILM